MASPFVNCILNVTTNGTATIYYPCHHQFICAKIFFMFLDDKYG